MQPSKRRLPDSSPCHAPASTACRLQEWAQQLEALVLREGLSPRLEAGGCAGCQAVAFKRRRWAGFLPSAGVQDADFGLPGAPAGATRAEAKAAATAAHWGDPPRAGGLYWATYKVRWQACDWMLQQGVLFAHLPAH